MLLAKPSGLQPTIGPQGEPGPAGPQGIPAAGPQGPQGASLAGPQGTQGQSNVGTQGNQGAQGVGAQGPQGITNIGPQGDPGAPGADGVVPPLAEVSNQPTLVLNNPPAPWVFVTDDVRATRSGSIITFGAICTLSSPTPYALPLPINFDFVLPKATFGTPVPISGTTLTNFVVYVSANVGPSVGIVALFSQDATNVTYRVTATIDTTLPGNTDIDVEFNCTWYTQ